MKTKYKLAPVEPTPAMCVTGFLVSEAEHDPAGVYKAMLDAAPEVEKVGFCEDTALSLAERTFSSEVDEHLAEDVIQYARRLHGMYTAPQQVSSIKCPGAGCTDQGCPAHYANDYPPIGV